MCSQSLSAIFSDSAASRSALGDAFDKQVVGPRIFVDAILHDYMPTPSFEQGFKVQQVLDAALESHQTGERVEIDA